VIHEFHKEKYIDSYGFDNNAVLLLTSVSGLFTALPPFLGYLPLNISTCPGLNLEYPTVILTANSHQS
jgi:hypothetical protein